MAGVQAVTGGRVPCRVEMSYRARWQVSTSPARGAESVCEARVGARGVTAVVRGEVAVEGEWEGAEARDVTVHQMRGVHRGLMWRAWTRRPHRERAGRSRF